MQSPLYHLNSTPLGSGSVIEPGNWGRIIKIYGPAHSRFAPESALEDVRAREYPSLPSRLDAAFLFDDIGEARFYRDIQQQLMMILYEVELIDSSAALHVADWRAVSQHGQMDLGWARDYWSGRMLPPHESGHACRELLTTSALQIRSRLPY